MHLRLAVAMLAALGGVTPTAGREPLTGHPWSNPRLSPDVRARLILERMTTDEKLTLVFGYFGSNFPLKPNVKPPVEARPGSAGYVPGIPRLGIPPQWQTDAGIGVATQGGAAQKRGRTALPSGIATAATWNPKLAFAGGAMIGAEARASGFNVMLGGGVNLMREPRNGRAFEYAGEDPLLAGTMVGAQIAGIQSNNIISTIKHFAFNDQETDRHRMTSVVDPTAARMSDLLAFQLAIERGEPGSVMCSYNKVNGTYACENPWLLTKVLRDDWKWPGYVMTDWGAAHSTAAAANAGLDQDSGFPLDDKPYFAAPLKEAVTGGDVPIRRLDEMVTRILRSMFAHGLFDHPLEGAPLDLDPAMLQRGAAVTLADAEQGIVLLKNAGHALPLSREIKRILLVGGNADRGVLAGGGSSLVYPVGGNAVPGIGPKTWPGPVMYYPDAPLEAIRRQAPGASVSFVDGTDATATAAAARSADAVVVFANQWAGEAFDVSLSLKEDDLIATVAAANPNTIVVLQSGGPVLTPWVDKVSGLIEAWYPGTRGGEAIARVLFGSVNPSGRLPVSFPRRLDQLPRPSAPHSGDTSYIEGAAVGYKWFDLKGYSPAFPFGFGLSYTDYQYDSLSAAAVGDRLVVSFTVRNTGSRRGMAVPQVYISGDGWEAPKRLGGFTKVDLAPGASRRVKLTIDPRIIAIFEESSGQWIRRAGLYRVLLGGSSRDISTKIEVSLPSWIRREAVRR